MAFKTFADSTVLTASDLNTYLMKQAVITCTSGTRPSSPVEGMTIYETDTDRVMIYSGSAWETGLNLIDWTSFTPTLSLDGAGTDWTLGDAVTSCKYAKVGRMVVVQFKVVFGSTSTYGTKALAFATPLPTSYSTPIHVGTGLALDASVGTGYGLSMYAGGSRVIMQTQQVNATYIAQVSTTATVPFTWAPSDEISALFVYLATQ